MRQPALQPGLIVAPLTPFTADSSRWMHYGLAPAMKAAMNLIGVPVGDPYPPYAPLSRDDMAALAAYLKTTVLAPRVAAAAA